MVGDIHSIKASMSKEQMLREQIMVMLPNVTRDCDQSEIECEKHETCKDCVADRIVALFIDKHKSFAEALRLAQVDLKIMKKKYHLEAAFEQTLDHIDKTLNYMEVILIKCDCCGELVSNFYNDAEWWGKYLKTNEDKICLNCIKSRDGFVEDFKSIIGFDISVLPYWRK